MEPMIAVLNGVPCIQESIGVGGNSNEKLRYYFLLSKSRAVELVFSLIDNTDRPGLPGSDWRSRAEELRSKFLSNAKFRIEGNISIEPGSGR